MQHVIFYIADTKTMISLQVFQRGKNKKEEEGEGKEGEERERGEEE